MLKGGHYLYLTYCTIPVGLPNIVQALSKHCQVAARPNVSFYTSTMAAAGLKSEFIADFRRTQLIHKRSRHSVVFCPRRRIPTHHPFVCTLDKLATSLGR